LIIPKHQIGLILNNITIFRQWVRNRLSPSAGSRLRTSAMGCPSAELCMFVYIPFIWVVCADFGFADHAASYGRSVRFAQDLKTIEYTRADSS